MVANMRQREQRHYPMGPLKQDVPLKVFDETDQLDYAENIRRLSAERNTPDGWPLYAVLVAAGVVAVLLIGVTRGWIW